MKIAANLDSKGSVAIGLRGSGKTNFARFLAGLDPDSVLVYDPLKEFTEFDTIQPKVGQFPRAAEEFANHLTKIDIKNVDKHPYRLLVIDEAHRVAPGGGKSLHPFIHDMNAVHRHWPLAILWIVRRPTELHPEIVNLSDHMFIWRLPGARDAVWLEDTAKGLSEDVRSLDEFHFVYVNQHRNFWQMSPVADQSRTS